ncbi:MAG: hypothetical protein ACR2LM_15520 [Pyrinomonadaceae bacterium]
MKRFAMAIALACVFVTNTLAGDIPSGDFVPPPPPPAAAPADNDGDISDGITEEITDEFVLAIFSMFAR